MPAPKFVLACVVGICLLAFGMFGHARELVSAFTNSVTAISTGAEYLRYMAITICFLTALYSVNGAFEGAGRNLPVLMVASVMYLGVELPLILWLMQRPDFALSDVWTAVTISTLVGAVFTAWLFHRDLWVPATPIIRDLNSEGFK